MDIISTINALAALAQESRLNAFRLLVCSGRDGLAAGEIARQLSIPHNTLSSHLSILSNARLVTSHREGRSIIYQINFDGTRDLLSYLVEDCCQGQSEICSPLLDSLLPDCCANPGIIGEQHEKNAR